MHDFIIFTIGGLATASIYAITASGLTLTYATTGIFNWSHGAIGMLAAFAYWQMHIGWGWPTLVSFAVCLFVLAPLLGIVLEVGVMRRLEGTSEAAKLVVTLALALSMVGIAQWIWDPQTYRALPPLFAGDTLVIGAIRISYNDVVVLAVALAVAIGLRLLLYRTRIGVTMRASVDDRTLTTLNGASSVRSARSAWVVGCVLAALAGILVAPTVTLSATALTLLIVDAYAASVIGRLRSIPMTFVGAIILGLAVSYSVAYLPQNSYIQGFEGAVPAVVLFVSLLLLPQSRLRGHGLLRSRELALVPTWRGTAIFGALVVLFSVMVATVVSQSDLYSLDRVWGLAIVGLSLVPVVGYAGRLSLCQMTFAGIGAVVVGHLGGNPLSLLAAAGICSVAGVLVALPALRLSGIYFALSTAAFATAMDVWVFPLPAFDLFGHQFAPFGSGSLNFVPFHAGGWVLSSKEAQFVVGAVVFVLLAALVVLVRRSEFGSRLFAFKDSPVACATLGMNTRLLPIAVFAISAAIAGVGGALYGEALGSAAPDVYQFLTGLTVLLTMVVAGIGAVGAGVGTGYFLGGPTLTNFFPSLTQLQTVLVGGSAVGVGTSPNGLIPSGLRPVWSSVVRRRALLGALILTVSALWGLRLAGVIGNWPFAWALFAIFVGCSVVPYALDRRRGDVPAAFGMPAVVSSGPAALGSADAPLALQDLTPMPGQASAAAGTGHMALEVHGVSVNFGGLAALSDVSLDVPDGSITGLIGPNGAGKTTLFDVITGMRRPSRGEVRFNDRDLKGVSPYRRSRLGLGRTFQRLELFGTLTVRENVRVAASVGRRRARRPGAGHESVDEVTDGLLRRVHLEALADTRADTLPTGTGRLVELARALAIHPTTLLLDEPAAGQNPEETSRFGGILRTLSDDGLAILLVEHDMELVMSVCDTVFVLVQGAILCSGTPIEVQSSPAVVEAYLGSLVEADGG